MQLSWDLCRGTAPSLPTGRTGCGKISRVTCVDSHQALMPLAGVLVPVARLTRSWEQMRTLRVCWTEGLVLHLVQVGHELLDLGEIADILYVAFSSCHTSLPVGVVALWLSRHVQSAP